MPLEDKKIEDERFYKKSFFMPFGMFNTDKKSVNRSAETLIGRNKERDTFIRRLLNSGRGGAYLITGQRGTGKTSFVDYCLAAYEQASVKRFANSTLAKSGVDNLFSLFFVVVLMLLPGMAATLLAHSQPGVMPKVLFGAPILIFCLVLWRISYQSLKDALYMPVKRRQKFKRTSNLDWMLPALSTILCVVIAVLAASMLYSLGFLNSLFVTFILNFGFFVLFFIILAPLNPTLTLPKILLIFIPKSMVTKVSDKGLFKAVQLANKKGRLVGIAIVILYCAKALLTFIYAFALFSLVVSDTVFIVQVYSYLEYVRPFIVSAMGVFYFEEFSLLMILGIILANLLTIIVVEHWFVINPAQALIQSQTMDRNGFILMPEFLIRSKAQKKVIEEIGKYEFSKLEQVYHKYYRDLLKTSWLGCYISIWQPIIKININLGFDNIEHSNILYGLLKQLKAAYTKCFLSTQNIHVLLTKIFIALVIFMLSIQLGDSIFSFKSPVSKNLYSEERLSSAIVPAIFGFQLKSRNTADERYDLFVTLTHPNRNADCVDLPKGSVLSNLLGVNGNKKSFDNADKESIKMYKCSNNESKAFMLQKGLFYLLYADILTIKNYQQTVSLDEVEQLLEAISEQDLLLLDSLLTPDFSQRLSLELDDDFMSFKSRVFSTEQLKKFEYSLTRLKNRLKENHFGFLLNMVFDRSIFPFDSLYYQLPKSSNLSDKHEGLAMSAVPIVRDKAIPYEFSLRAYHVYIMILLTLLYFLINRFLPILPYRANCQKITHVIDKLTATQSKESLLKLGSVAVPVPFAKGAEYKPLESRDVEQHFIEVVAALTAEDNCLLNKFISVPTPDITIVFDELDKLGSTAKEQEQVAANRPLSEFSHSFEFARSTKIKELLSDLKNVIDSKYCRFILIGGRHLRDEWLADQTKRDQLLPSIFDQSIYLPSLLTDSPKYELNVTSNQFLTRIWEYLCQQKGRAIREYKNTHVINTFILSFGERRKVDLRFGSQSLVESRVELIKKQNKQAGDWRFDFYHADGRINAIEDGKSIALMNTFVKYLAYRSHGIPKRLNESFAEFIKPLSRVLSQHDYDQTVVEDVIHKCNDVVLLNDIDLYRIQLNGRLYDRIDKHLGRKLYGRDDKIVTAVFFITDYLFKFHTRAFDWDSLEKIDDIADINRAPDLRNVVHELVEVFYEMVLHPVLNGMYSFRFKSSLAREIAFLSKLSPTDSAAFNFTLDESQALKELYSRRLEMSSGSLPEVCAALGELYEYDQEYSAGRKQYTIAIQMIDEQISNFLLYKAEEPKERIFYGYMSIMDKLEQADGNTIVMAVSNIIDWAIFRLRLMLKVGMTFELTRNYERAQAYYHEAHMLSRRFLALVFTEKPGGMIASIDDKSEVTYFNTKHFNILYQAVFAKAWLAEKIGAGVDTSLTIVKTELFYFESMFSRFRLSENLEEYITRIQKGLFSHASFGLIKSEFYNKAGDLCFFKGANLPDATLVNNISSVNSEISKHGYLYKASYYYAASLHYLRRFNLYRHEASKLKYSPDKRLATFSPEQLPKYPLIEIASSLADVAELLLARVDISALIQGLLTGTKTCGLSNHNVYLAGFFDGQNSPNQSQAELKKSLANFMVTAGVHFDKWLKYQSETEVTTLRKYKSNYAKSPEFVSFQKAAELERQSKYSDYEFNFTLWRNENGSNYFVDEHNFVDVWFGTAKQQHPLTIGGDIIDSSGSSSCPIERVLCYMAIINTSVTYLKNSGKTEEAAYELRRAADSLIAILDLLYLIKTKKPKGVVDNNQQQTLNSSTSLLCFVNFLIEYAIYFIDRSAIMYAQLSVDRGDHKQFDKVTSVISSKLILSAINLCITANKMTIAWQSVDIVAQLRHSFQNRIKPKDVKEEDHYFSLKQIILNVVKSNLCGVVLTEPDVSVIESMFSFDATKIDKVDGFPNDKGPSQWLEILAEVLEQRCLYKRFPVLNRLKMLKQLVIAKTGHCIDNKGKNELFKLVDFAVAGPIEAVFKETLFDVYDLMCKSPINTLLNKKISEKLISALKGGLENWKTCVQCNDCQDSPKVARCHKHTQAYCNEDYVVYCLIKLDELQAEAISHCRELLELEEKYNSPHHFTPADVAYTCFYLASSLMEYRKFLIEAVNEHKIDMSSLHKDIQERFKMIQKKRKSDAKYFFLRANEYFNKSKQMYTLRSEFYKSIGDLYYLYDDFNDRYIHHGKALQILSLTVSVAIEKQVHEQIKHIDKETLLPI